MHADTCALPHPMYRVKDETVATRKAYGEALATLGSVAPQVVVSLDAEVKNSTYAEIFEQAFPLALCGMLHSRTKYGGHGCGLCADG